MKARGGIVNSFGMPLGGLAMLTIGCGVSVLFRRGSGS